MATKPIPSVRDTGATDAVAIPTMKRISIAQENRKKLLLSTLSPSSNEETSWAAFFCSFSSVIPRILKSRFAIRTVATVATTT